MAAAKITTLRLIYIFSVAGCVPTSFSYPIPSQSFRPTEGVTYIIPVWCIKAARPDMGRAQEENTEIYDTPEPGTQSPAAPSEAKISGMVLCEVKYITAAECC